jgi:outer membrane protein assembly factor BamB
VRWKEPRGVPEVPSPLVYRNSVAIVKDGGIVSGLDPKDGRLLFRGRAGATGAYFASPVAGDGKVYLASFAGKVVVLEGGPTLKTISVIDLKDPIVATPAIADGALYVRAGRTLWAFGSRR